MTKVLLNLSIIFIYFVTGGLVSCTNNSPNDSTETKQVQPSPLSPPVEQAKPEVSKVDVMDDDNITLNRCKNTTQYNVQDCIKFANYCGSLKQALGTQYDYEGSSDTSVVKCKEKGWTFK